MFVLIIHKLFMRLLYIHQYFRFPEQSGGTRSYDLATSFVKRGIQVTVISGIVTERINKKEKWNVFEREGIKFYILNSPYYNKMSFKRRIASFLYFMWNASIKALQIDCDCILATSTPLTVAIPALIRKWIKKTPYVFEARDVWPEVPIRMGFIKNSIVIKFLYWFEKLVYKNASSIVSLSIGMDKNIKSRYSNNKSTIIPNISEISRFSNVIGTVPINVPIQNKKIVLYAGSISIVNGIKYVVDLAYETLKFDPNIVYFIFGNGRDKDDVRKYAKEKDVLDKNFFMFDPVKKDDLPYIYSIATVGSSFVIDNPILWDNSANKFFDTLAASKPIVINYKGWQAEDIKKNNVGYILSPQVNEDEANKFIRYINNDELLKEQSINAHLLAIKEYSLEVAVEKYLKIFNGLIVK